jgi:hypothetical protein
MAEATPHAIAETASMGETCAMIEAAAHAVAEAVAVVVPSVVVPAVVVPAVTAIRQIPVCSTLLLQDHSGCLGMIQ